MRLVSLATSLLVAAVAAQDLGWIGDLPECPRNCIYSNLAIGTKTCGMDTKCLCGNQAYQKALMDCSNSKCTPDQTKQLKDGGDEFCRQVGVTVVLEPTEAPKVVEPQATVTFEVPIPNMPSINIPVPHPVPTQLPSIPMPGVGVTTVDIPVAPIPTLPTLPSFPMPSLPTFPMPSIPNPKVTFPGATIPGFTFPPSFPGVPTPAPAPGDVAQAASDDESPTEPTVTILPTNVSAPVYPMPSFTPMPFEGGASLASSVHMYAIAIGILAFVL